MLGDKLEEELEFEKENKAAAQIDKMLKWADALSILKRNEKPFYVIGNNKKLKTMICIKVKTKTMAYQAILKYKLTNYVFAEYIFEIQNMEKKQWDTMSEKE